MLEAHLTFPYLHLEQNVLASSVCKQGKHMGVTSRSADQSGDWGKNGKKQDVSKDQPK